MAGATMDDAADARRARGPSWEVRRGKARAHVIVVFRGKISEEDGVESSRAFLTTIGDDAVDLIFDVRGVESYAGRARQAWQDALLPRRRQVRSLSVLTRSRLTRMGASVFAMILGIECRMLDELPADLQRA